MKSVLLFFCIIIGGCCSNRNVISNTFTNEEKLFVPYRENDIVKWNTHNGEIISGTITNYSSKIERDSDEYCNSYESEQIDVNLLMNNERYSISLEKRGSNNISLNILQSVNEISKLQFGVDVSHFGFTTIEFNNETFTNAIKLDAYREGDVYLGTLIYSKTNGIEFILFADGTWYKRVE